MPNDLINTDPIVAQNFFLEIDGNVITILSGVSGLDVEVDVVSLQQAGKDGKVQTVKTLGQANKAPDLQLTRMAPADAKADALWGWFTDIQTKGFGISNRAASRKNGSIVLYDSTGKETGRFNFFNGWPSKISTDALSVDSNEAVKETITLVVERLERVK
jgi:phage tail-like protein